MSPFLLTGLAALSLTTISVAVPAQLLSESIQWVDCAKNVPQPLQGIELPATLPSTLHCGRLDVPMDYTRPISSSNKITVGFSMYRSSNPQGLINL
jgi:hypothetical protein